MTEKSPQGHHEGLFDMLADLTGHLEISHRVTSGRCTRCRMNWPAR